MGRKTSRINDCSGTGTGEAMKIRPEYQKIADEYVHYALAIQVAERCQELADRPPKESKTRPKIELREDYAEIVRAVRHAFDCHEKTITGAITTAVEMCQELADRPPKELSNAEWREIWDSCACITPEPGHARAIVNAYLAKQSEPEPPKTVRLRMMQENSGGVLCQKADYKIWPAFNQRWVSEEFDSPPIYG